MKQKVCTKCGITKPFSDFYEDENHTDGIRSDCKSCFSIQTGLYAKSSRKKRRLKHELLWKENQNIKKECRICHVSKALADFNAHSGNKDGLRRECKICQSILARKHYKTIAVEARKQKKIYRKENPDVYRNLHYKNKFGITLKEYRGMLKSQNKKCAICGNGKSANPNGRRLSVDHDHKTGRVRALLCGNCNAGLGSFMDNSKLLRKAISYLETF